MTPVNPTRSEAGFTIIEMMVASLITMVVMGVAFSTFDNALALNETVASMADSSQNLRAGTNLLVRDLMQVGRNLPIGGVSIPSGTGSSAIKRPSPPNKSYFFNNTTATTLTSITSGANLGPTVDGRLTDMVTILMDDALCCITQSTPEIIGELNLYPSDAPNTRPRLALDGSSFSLGSTTVWMTGDTPNGIAPIKAGDLIYFNAPIGSAIQTVTRVDATTVYFEANDPFNLNQRNAAAGSITQVLPPPPSESPCNVTCGSVMSVRRVLMYTYYVHEESAGVPRLMRALNMFAGTALAGVVEDLDLSYDLVDGVNNPVNVGDLPYTANGVTYTASQIRKANIHVGVRSETMSARTKDYLRNHVSTVISLRNLAYVDRYK